MQLITEGRAARRPWLALVGSLAALTGAQSALAQAAPPEVGAWPKVGFETVVAADFAGLAADSGKGRGASPDVRFDSGLLVEFDSALSLAALFQYKSREPRPAGDPNRELFANQGVGRSNGGKMKELYLRYGDWRVGKFVQNFGRGYALLPGPYAADFIEEAEEGYEPSDMLGVEKIHVYDDESEGWRQLSVALFMVDRTFLHRSFPYDEGRIRYRDGGVGNTRLPSNLMVTWDTINMPVGNWAHMSYQASVIRWGKSYRADKRELWGTLGADLSIPLNGTVDETLRGRYSQLRFYVEAARRQNFEGLADSRRDYLSGSAEYLTGPWVFDVTTTQRWTHGPSASRRDAIYSTTVGYTLPSASVVALSAARETIAGRAGVYAGVRLTQTFTTCSRCLTKGRYF